MRDVSECVWPVGAPAGGRAGSPAASAGSVLTLAPVRLEDSTERLGMDGTGPPAWFSCRRQNQAGHHRSRLDLLQGQ